jgi:nucleotide-binding universal stress UspA family protein
VRPVILRTILAATDLSGDNVPALRSAMQLAHLAAAHLHVVHACAAGEAALAQPLERHMRAADPESEVLPGATIRTGPADHVIVEVAKAIDADVIVLGPHQHQRSRSAVGTAYRVAATSERPCLVLPGAMQLPLGRVLVPIDASGAARGALVMAMTWASALRRRRSHQSAEPTELVIMHVTQPANPGDSTAREVIEDAVAAVTGHVDEVTGVTVRRVSDQGEDVAERIVHRAVTADFDLIVLGTRGELAAASTLGSVSSAVVRSATCPLLLVPPRLWRELGDDQLA